MQRPSGLRWECGEELKTAKGCRCGWSSVGNEVGENGTSMKNVVQELKHLCSV